mmetsp:Transcript_55443/g.127421  ORF Transcript_55443/g.127421 Transcript_55443/m.127421 type:complete len:257 (-) Transcript_55443:418-1188(-)
MGMPTASRDSIDVYRRTPLASNRGTPLASIDGQPFRGTPKPLGPPRACQGILSGPLRVPTGPASQHEASSTPKSMHPSRHAAAGILSGPRRVAREETRRLFVQSPPLSAIQLNVDPPSIGKPQRVVPRSEAEAAHFPQPAHVKEPVHHVRLVAVRATPKQRQQLGTHEVVTPVRRSVRPDTARHAESKSVAELLELTGLSYTPNATLQRCVPRSSTARTFDPCASDASPVDTTPAVPEVLSSNDGGGRCGGRGGKG